jgi:hypothetical protein
VVGSPKAGLEDYTLRFTSQRDYEVTNANGEGGSPFYFQVHSANGAMHGNVFMSTEKKR